MAMEIEQKYCPRYLVTTSSWKVFEMYPNTKSCQKYENRIAISENLKN